MPLPCALKALLPVRLIMTVTLALAGALFEPARLLLA